MINDIFLLQGFIRIMYIIESHTKNTFYTGLWFLRIFYFLFFYFFLQNSLCLKMFLKERSTCTCTLYCFQTSSFLFVGMWRVCKSSKMKHPGGSGGFVLETKGRPRPATHFYFSRFFFYFCQIESMFTTHVYNACDWMDFLGRIKYILLEEIF